MSYTVHVTGIRELQRSLAKGSDELKRFNDELVKLAEPVRADATSRGSRYAAIGAFKVYRRGTTVVVAQSKGKVTGLRGDFGALQMRNVLTPALEAKEGEIVSGVEQWIDRLVDGAGL